MTDCPKIAKALHEIMEKVSYVQKTGTNDFHKYKYAGEADLLAVLRPAMVEAGLMLLPSVQSLSPVDEHGNVSVMIDYTLVHKDGEVWPEKITAAGMGNDRAKNGTVGDKGVYKAITGANKYVLFKLFQIETGNDPEQASDHDEAGDYSEPPIQPQWKETKHPLKEGDRRKLWERMMDDLNAEAPKGSAAMIRYMQHPDTQRDLATLEPWKDRFRKEAKDLIDIVVEAEKATGDNVAGVRQTVPPNFDSMSVDA